MVPEPVDQVPMVPAPVKDQGPMVPEPVDQGPMVPAPIKDQGPTVPEPVRMRAFSSCGGRGLRLAAVLPRPGRGAGTLIPSAQRLGWDFSK